MISIPKLIVSANEAKTATVSAAKEEREFHEQMAANLKAQNDLLERIAIQVGVPSKEIDEIFAKHSIY